MYTCIYIYIYIYIYNISSSQGTASIILWGNTSMRKVNMLNGLDLFGRKAIGITGNFSMHGRRWNQSWSRMVDTREPGDIEIEVEGDVSDWANGSEILIGPTEYSGDQFTEVETRLYICYIIVVYIILYYIILCYI